MKTMQATELRQDIYGALERVASTREPVEILKHNRAVATLYPSTNLPAGRRKPLIDLDAISSFCKRHRVQSFAFFGSILRDDFDEKSDVDVIVDVRGRCLGFHEECRMVEELETMFGRKVDMLPAHYLDSPQMNKHRSASISKAAKVVYDALA